MTADVVALLDKPLKAEHIKTREQSGQKLSYIEGHTAIREANRIFGFEGWARKTEILNQVQAELKGDKWYVAYTARVTVSVGSVDRDGIGFGQGISKDLGAAHESAIKEAETDACKRAMMTFGDPFGLALYDKKQEHVEKPAEPVADGKPWLKSIGFNREGAEAFEKDCIAMGSTLLDMATECRKQGCKSPTDIQAYMDQNR